MTTLESTATPPPKRQRVAANLYQRQGADGRTRYEDVRVDPGTGKQRLRLLRARTLTEARREQRALAVAIDRGEVVSPTRLTVAEVAQDYFSAAASRVANGEMAARTPELYQQRWRTQLEPRIGRMRVQQVQAVHIGAVLRELRDEGLSSWTLNGVLSAAAAIFAHAVARGWILESPTRRLARGERPRGKNRRQARVLSPEEVERVIDAARPRWHPLIVAAAHTGARVSELLGLQWGDVAWDDNTLTISKQLGRDGKICPCKTANSVRTIGMSADLRRVLRETYLASSHKGQGDFIFSCASGRAPTYANARQALADAVTAAGIEYDTATHRVSFHGFRHGAASALIRAGTDSVRVARFLGDDVKTVLSTYAGEWATASDENLGDVLADALSLRAVARDH